MRTDIDGFETAGEELPEDILKTMHADCENCDLFFASFETMVMYSLRQKLVFLL